MDESEYMKADYNRTNFFEKLRAAILQIKNLPIGDRKPDDFLARKMEQKIETMPNEGGSEFNSQRVQTIEEDRKPNKRHYLNLFSVERGACQCSKQCEQYRGSFNIKQDLFHCLNCGCPMNSHSKIRDEKSFSNSICQKVNRRYIAEEHLNFKGIVCIYLVDQMLFREARIDIESLYTTYNEGGYNILSFYDMDMSSLQKFLMKKHSRVNYNRFFELLQLNPTADVFQLKALLKDPEDMAHLENFVKGISKVNIRLSAAQAHESNTMALVFLVESARSITEFNKFLIAAKQKLPAEMQLFYTSKSKVKAIRDCCIFFQSFMSISINTFMIFQQIEKLVIDPKVDSVKRFNDQFLDFLDFNNFSVLKQNFTEPSSRFLDGLSRFVMHADRLIKMATGERGQIQMKIAAKVGPPSVSVLSSVPNYYRFQAVHENLSICQEVFRDLFVNHRILVIFRPVVVKSQLEQYFKEIYILNQFIEIDTVYHRFTHDEASMLATLENIHASNYTNYLTMMTEGFSLICLFARPGAFHLAKLLAEGCVTGLRVRETNKIGRLFIEHEVLGKQVIEEVPTGFTNIFKNFSQVNVFQSIKEIFNLEAIVHTGAPVQDHVLKEIPRENFNFYTYTTRDEISTEQLCSLFMPKCTLIEPIIVILKDSTYSERVKELLKTLKFTIFEELQILIEDGKDLAVSNVIQRDITQKLKEEIRSKEDLKKQEAIDQAILKEEAKLREEAKTRYEFKIREILNLTSQQHYPSEHLQKIITTYMGKNITLFLLMKPAGNMEMRNFLQDYTIEKVPVEPIITSDLQKMLIPCLNVPSIRRMSKYFNPDLAQFDAQIAQQNPYILKYILAVTMGVEMLTQNELKVVDSKNHAHFRVTTQRQGQFEIRVRKNIKGSNYSTSYMNLISEYELLSWYYVKVNQSWPQRCPLSYQYRMNYPERVEAGEIDQIFDVQEFVGDNFLQEIFRQLFEFGNNIFEKIKQDMVTEVEKKERPTIRDQKIIEEHLRNLGAQLDKRLKMLAYFWGVKLAKFVKELEYMSKEEFPNGYGAIQPRNGKYECQYRLGDHYGEAYKHYESIQNELLDYIREHSTSDFMDLQNSQLQSSHPGTQANMNINNYETILNKHFQLVFGPDAGRIFEFAIQPQNLRLIPRDVKLSSLRILSERQKIHIKQMKERSHAFDWEYEKKQQVTQGHEPYLNYVLCHTLPQVKCQYELVAQILYLLHIEVKLFKSQEEYVDTNFTESLQNSTVMAKSMTSITKITYEEWFKAYKVDKHPIVNEIINGFEKSYFIEEEFIKQIQQIYKEIQTLKPGRRTRTPDVIKMFLYLRCMDEMGRYMAELQSTKDRITSLNMEHQMRVTQIYNENRTDLDTNQWRKEQEIDNLLNEIHKIENRLKQLITYTANMKLDFDAESTERGLRNQLDKEEKFNLEYFITQMQKEPDDNIRDENIEGTLKEYFNRDTGVQKQFLPSDKYFQPLEQGNNTLQWGKLDQEQIDEELKKQEDERKARVQVQMRDYSKTPYQKDHPKDNIQQAWANTIVDTAAGRFVDTRPDNKKTGIYLDAVKTIEKKLDDKVDLAIKKFMQDKMNNFKKS